MPLQFAATTSGVALNHRMTLSIKLNLAQLRGVAVLMTCKENTTLDISDIADRPINMSNGWFFLRW
jgi:hypothetical protein